MLKKLLIAVSIASFCLPAWAGDWEPFNGDLTLWGEPYTSDSMTESLNQIIKSHQTVESLLDHLIDSLSSGEINETSLLATNLKSALRMAQQKGYGSAKFERWRWKYIKGACDNKVIVFYATVLHSSKKHLFGFYLSAGPGAIDESGINRGSTGEECH